MAASVRRLASIEGWVAGLVLAAAAGCGSISAQAPKLPSALAYDALGNLYIADRDRNEVLELSASGALTIFAGNSAQGFSGDGGPAASAMLNAPQGIAVGADGTVYVADTNNQRIRAIANGVIQTFAGTGVRGFSGDGSAATGASLNSPSCVAVDLHNTLLICDTGNQRIRTVKNGVIGTLAGSGVQGFSGDGGVAAAAELNGPRGVAVDGLGRTFIADTLNQRVRIIGTDGTITTIAGDGSAGYSGDGGAATAASLSFPTAVNIDAAGDVFIADTDNERIRMVSASGTISTLAGSGVQGFTADGGQAVAVSLDQPLATALNAAGSPVFCDSQNSRVRMVTSNGQMVTLVPVQAATASQITVIMPAQAVYGTPAATVTVVSQTGTPSGNVDIVAGMSVIATAALQNGAAVLSLGALAVGTYQVQARYSGDMLRAASASAAQTLTITPAVITASATAASVSFGQAIPPLNGTITGLLPQDAATTSVQFSTSATASSPAGTYSIVATLTGPSSANYTLLLSPSSGALTILSAATAITLQSPTVASYAGLPIVLSAQVTASTAAVVAGVVQFYDGSTLAASGSVVNGAASTAYTPTTSGTHSLTASYSGTANFLPSASAPLLIATSDVPDFSISASANSQTVQGGLPATYSLNVASSSGVFTGVVTFAVSGLPKGATAVFAPAVVVPGISGTTTNLTVQTVPLSALSHRTSPLIVLWSCSLPVLFLCLVRSRRKLAGTICVGLAFGALMVTAGCGARVVDSAVASAESSQLTVSATSTNLAGEVVTHTLNLSLRVE